MSVSSPHPIDVVYVGGEFRMVPSDRFPVKGPDWLCCKLDLTGSPGVIRRIFLELWSSGRLETMALVVRGGAAWISEVEMRARYWEGDFFGESVAGYFDVVFPAEPVPWEPLDVA